MQTAKPNAMQDLKRDWESWSLWERRAVTILAILSFAASAVWLAMSLEMVL